MTHAEGAQADSPDPNSDLKAKMREALERKKSHGGINASRPAKEKAHGAEVTGGATPRMHRRKAGGGGA